MVNLLRHLGAARSVSSGKIQNPHIKEFTSQVKVFKSKIKFFINVFKSHFNVFKVLESQLES